MFFHVYGEFFSYKCSHHETNKICLSFFKYNLEYDLLNGYMVKINLFFIFDYFENGTQFQFDWCNSNNRLSSSVFVDMIGALLKVVFFLRFVIERWPHFRQKL